MMLPVSGELLKGAFHIHAAYQDDDGKNKMDEIVAIYKSMGYDFIIYTPHTPNLVDARGLTKDNFTIIYGYEDAPAGEPHIIFVDNITILAHPFGQLWDGTLDIFRIPRTDFVEVINNGRVCAWPLLKNSIPAEDLHDLSKDVVGKTWIELECESNDVESIFAALYRAKDAGRISWGYNKSAIDMRLDTW